MKFTGSTLLRGGEPVVVSRGTARRGGARSGMVRLGTARTTHATASRGFDSSGVSPWLGMARQCWARHGSDGRAQAWSGKVTRVPVCGGSTPPTRAVRGRAGQGMVRRVGVRFGTAGSGVVRPGDVGSGTARIPAHRESAVRLRACGPYGAAGIGRAARCVAGQGPFGAQTQQRQG